MKVVTLILSIFFTLTPTFAVEKERKLNLVVDTPDAFYQVQTQGKYLRFRWHGEEEGFYLKACHKSIHKSISRAFKKAVLSLGRSPASNEKEYGRVVVGKTTYKVTKENFQLSDFNGLQEKLNRWMILGAKRCP